MKETTGSVVTVKLGPHRIVDSKPSDYRLGTRDGVYVLQGFFGWEECPMSETADRIRERIRGGEWRDLPTVELPPWP